MGATTESEGKWFTSESLIIFMSHLGIVDRFFQAALFLKNISFQFICRPQILRIKPISKFIFPYSFFARYLYIYLHLTYLLLFYTSFSKICTHVFLLILFDLEASIS